MRRIVMFNRVTADGYFAGPDGNLNRVVLDPREIEAMKRQSGKDMIVFGSGSIVSGFIR